VKIISFNGFEQNFPRYLISRGSLSRYLLGISVKTTPIVLTCGILLF